jgi:SH3-like domain-containing protein
MTREEYIKMRKAGGVTYELLFEYYIDRAKVPIVDNVRDFRRLWDISGGDATWDVKRVTDYYDQKFNVIYLFDKGGQVINAYENHTNKGSLHK